MAANISGKAFRHVDEQPAPVAGGEGHGGETLQLGEAGQVAGEVEGETLALLAQGVDAT
ncbi:MAG: hypothetical protein U1F77_12425 [Kiritimatiellia bacterium]